MSAYENAKIVHVLVPVKDSIVTAEQTIRAIVAGGYMLTVYDDYSTPENALHLDSLAEELHINVLHLSALTDHPSPNYRTILVHAQQAALAEGCHMLIVESDVVVQPDTISRMMAAVSEGVGMIAAVTHDAEGKINFPYEYARAFHVDAPCDKRLSFCCTLLTNSLLYALPFETLDPEKNWYDVYISRQSRKLGFTNILQVTNPVLHKPHSSRPWKQLKYSHPLLYYWRKLTQRKDKI